MDAAAQTAATPIIALVADRFRAPPVLAAEFTQASKTRSAILTINEIDSARGTRTHRETIEVLGKAEARKIAKAMGATPWNF